MGSQLGSAGLLLVNTLINIYLLLLMLRFLLQASRADYYNPISQSVVKVTQPLVGLFQGFLKPMGRFDLATLAAALILKIVAIIVVSFWQATEFSIVPAFSLENYQFLFGSAVTYQVFLATFKYALLTWVFTLGIGFTVAYFLAFHIRSQAMQTALFLIQVFDRLDRQSER